MSAVNSAERSLEMSAPGAPGAAPPAIAPQAVPHWASSLLQWPHCGSEQLDLHDDIGHCAACNANYPRSNTAYLLIDPTDYVDAAGALSPHLRGADPADVAIAFATALRYQLLDPVLRPEFSNILDRYFGVLERAGIRQKANSSQPTPTGATQFGPVTTYFEPRFQCGTPRYRSVRFRNTLSRTLNSDAIPPFFVSFWIFDRDGETLSIDNHRSRLPIPMAPGQSLTVPVLIVPPKLAGRYRIMVLLVEETVRWYQDAPLYEGELTVSDESLPWSLLNPPRVPYEAFDYERDVAKCGELFRAVVADATQELDPPRPVSVLEIACGSKPQALIHFQDNTVVIASDLAFPQVQIAALEVDRILYEHRDCYMFCSANVLKSPFRAGAFDVVMIVAALHHFEDALAALQQMFDWLRAGGRLVLMREPCFVNASDQTYLRELRNGFNEQQFEIEEYMWMLEQVGFDIVRISIDFGGSLKLAAVKPATRTG